MAMHNVGHVNSFDAVMRYFIALYDWKAKNGIEAR
jgi:hypothetical protein